MLATFSQGERTAILHAAFCPPFARTPRLEVQQIEGPPARIKTSQLFAHGARLELRLERAAMAAVEVGVLLMASDVP
jgi:hypothetical protein